MQQKDKKNNTWKHPTPYTSYIPAPAKSVIPISEKQLNESIEDNRKEQ